MFDPLTLQHVSYEDYNIVCTHNEYAIGLTRTDGITMNGKEEDFFIIKDA